MTQRLVLMVQVELHTYETARQLKWAWLTHAEDREVLLAFLENGILPFFSNIRSHFYVLQIGNRALPVTVNESEYENAYTCSPYTHYVTYGQEELWKLHNRGLATSLSLLNGALGLLLKGAKINRVVCLNNWLLSTNLNASWRNKEIKRMLEFLVALFPKHAILWRSLNAYTDPSLMDQLQRAGFRLIPAREIFILHEKLKCFSCKRSTVLDFELLARASDQIADHESISSADYPTIASLYANLYHKYSDCSPQFTETFIRLCHEKRFLNIRGMRDEEGKLCAVVGSFSRNGVLVTPLVGYDTHLPREKGLFRKITALAMQEALQKGLIFNISSGVTDFKRRRGAVKFIEYSAVYHKHLSPLAKTGWKALQSLMTNVGVPLLNKYNF